MYLLVSVSRVEEGDEDAPIYRPDLIVIGGMKVTGSGMVGPKAISTNNLCPTCTT